MIASLFKKKHRFSLSRTLGVTIALAGVMAQGCIGDDEGASGLQGPGAEGEADNGPGYSIKAYVKRDNGKYRLVELKALDDVDDESIASKGNESRLADGDLAQKQSAAVEIESAEDDSQHTLGDSTGYGIDVLAALASDSCFEDYVEANGSVKPPLPLENLSVQRSFQASMNTTRKFSRQPPFSDGYDHWRGSWHSVALAWPVAEGYYTTSSPTTPAQSCDAVLFIQSQLVCAASKLKAIADAVGNTPLGSRVIVPPQAAKDRHLIRRLAVETLAALPHIDAEGMVGGYSSCTALYSEGLADPSNRRTFTYRNAYFGKENPPVSPLPGIPAAPLALTSAVWTAAVPTNAIFHALLRPRLRAWVEHHRVAQQLLAELTQSTIDVGLANAEAVRADGGLTGMWGGDVQTAPNSLRGLLASLYGRVELDPIRKAGPYVTLPISYTNPLSEYVPFGDPQCVALNVDGPRMAALKDYTSEVDIFDNLGGLLPARGADGPAETMGQRRAQILVERLGIVMLEKHIVAAAGAGNLVALLREQLKITDAARLLPLPVTTTSIASMETLRGPSYDMMLDGLTDADVAFALRGTLAVYAQLTESPWPVTAVSLASSPPPATKNGLSRRADLEGTLLKSYQVVAGDNAEAKVYSVTASSGPDFAGVPRSALAGDAFGRVSIALASSQCRMQGWTQAAKAYSYQSIADTALTIHEAMKAPFVNAATQIGTFDPLIKQRLEVATGEYVSKMGDDGFVSANFTNFIGAEWVVAVKFHPSALQAPSAAALPVVDELNLAVIYGKPWEADCLAGQRTVCGSSFAPTYPLTITNKQPVVVDKWGVHTAYFTVPATTAVGNDLGNTAGGTDGNALRPDLLFLVQKPSPSRPGKVLGAFRHFQAQESRIALNGPRRRATNAVFVSTTGRTSGTRCLEGESSGVPRASCVAGIDRDQYVPLANELTSFSGVGDDSWKHYLSLAKEAAAEADELGTQIIDLGLQRDMRMEGAQEELAGLCGTYVDTSQVDFTSGSGEALIDGEVNACIQPDTVDVVFFQGGAALDEAGAKALIADSGLCTAGNPNRVCGTTWQGPDANSTDDDVEFRALDFPPPPGADAAFTVPGCGPLVGDEAATGELYVAANDSLTKRYFKDKFFDDSGYMTAIQTDPYTPAALASAIAKLNFVEDKNGVWGVYVNGGLAVLVGYSGPTPTLASLRTGQAQSWPLCRRMGNTCDAAAVAIERVILGSAPGTIDANLDGTLRRAVEGALWTAARLTGNLPNGLFTKIIPAVNYTPPTTTNLTVPKILDGTYWGTNYAGYVAADRDFVAPAPTIYSLGVYTKFTQGGVDYFNLNYPFFPNDTQVLGSLERWPRWSMDWYNVIAAVLDSSPARLNYLRPFIDGARLAPSTSTRYLAARVSNSSALFDRGPTLDPVTRLLPEAVTGLTLAQWLAAAASGEGADDAHLSVARDRLTGNRVKSLNMVRDGILYSHIVMRTDMCDPNNKDANVGDLVPDTAGAQTVDGAFAYKSTGDSYPTYGPTRLSRPGWAHNNILRDNGEDGYFTFIGAQYTDSKAQGICSGGGCTGSVRGVINGPITNPPTWTHIHGQRHAFSGAEWDGTPDLTGFHHVNHMFGYCAEYDSEYTAELLSASWWPPSARVQMFIDPGMDAESNLAAMGLLSCAARTGGTGAVSLTVPEITDPRQINVMRAWVDSQAQQIADWQRTMFLLDVPRAVADHIQGGHVNYAAVGTGEAGEHTLTLAQALLQVHGGFTTVYTGIRRVSDAIRDAETAITGSQIANDLALKQLAIDRTKTIGAVVKSAVSIVGEAMVAAAAGASLKPAEGAQASLDMSLAIIDLGINLSVLNMMGEQDALTVAAGQNSSTQILQEMSSAVAEAMAVVDDGVIQIKTGQIDALRAQNALAGVRSEAGFELAKASGADFADLDGNGEPETALPVNTVLRRSYSILEQRYERALESARRYAYLARLSIEQKLGVRMASLTEDFGPIPPPQGWVDRVCELTGVDYEALRSASSADGKVNGGGQAITEEEVISEFADQYVGDYVNRLEEFVEYYNVKYPFKEEGDGAVLSLRDDLVFTDSACQREAYNLLYHSDDLATRGEQSDPSNPELSLGGWSSTPDLVNRTTNVTTSVLAIEADWGVTPDPTDMIDGMKDVFAIAYPNPSPAGTYLPGPTVASGATLLLTRTGTALPVTAEPGPGPELSVYQSVFLRGGEVYYLSWRDMARTAPGGPAATNVKARYRVMITDEAWTPLAILDPEAVGGNNATWGSKSLDLYVKDDGNYHVVFSPVTTGASGAIAVANVQLESAESDGPRAYQATTGTRLLNSYDCGKGNPGMMRSSFVRRCEFNGPCYYELAKPIYLSEGLIAGGQSLLPGVAANNYNYRHGGVVLNLVGTGVLDCSASDESCFSQGFVEYDLIHNAFNAELLDATEESRCFSFGQGAVRHGKALAAERYLGIPMSSTDQDFISSNEFTQDAFRGRPLSGEYTLRIYETPELRWERIEDIQLYLQYGYWSRVETAQ